MKNEETNWRDRAAERDPNRDGSVLATTLETNGIREVLFHYYQSRRPGRLQTVNSVVFLLHKTSLSTLENRVRSAFV